MSNSRTLSRLVLAALVAALIAAPAAAAMPAGPHGTAVGTQDRQDARGEAAASGGVTRVVKAHGPFDPVSFSGPPTWPMSPAPLPPRVAPIPGADGGGGLELPVVLLVIAGALAIGGGMALAANRLHMRTAH